MLKCHNKKTIFTKNKIMLRKIFCILIVSISIVSCKKENSSEDRKVFNGVVTNFEGLNLFSDKDLSSGRLHHLNYASKIKIISIDSIKSIAKIQYRKQEFYTSLKYFELLSDKENEKSYFTNDCYCLLGLKEIKTINYPTKYDTIHYFVKDNKIRLIKEISSFQPSYEIYKEHDVDIDRETYNLAKPNMFSYFVVDKNDFLMGNFFTEENKSYLECYNKKTTYEVSANFSKQSDFYVTMDLNYAIKLFNVDLLFAKIDNNSFVKSLPIFNFKKEAIYIEQSDLYLEKPVNIKLYNLKNFSSVKYNDHSILFNYLREIKIIEKGGKKKYFAKINILETEGSKLSGEYYIDLNEISMFASIPD